MKCELKIIARDVKEGAKFLPTLGGLLYFAEVLFVETVMIVPLFIFTGINTVIITVTVLVIICVAFVYYNAMNECKEKEAN